MSFLSSLLRCVGVACALFFFSLLLASVLVVHVDPFATLGVNLMAIGFLGGMAGLGAYVWGADIGFALERRVYYKALCARSRVPSAEGGCVGRVGRIGAPRGKEKKIKKTHIPA